MSVQLQVSIIPHETQFTPSTDNGLEIETSFNSSYDDSKAIGTLRYESVSNGNYKSRHPIYDNKGNLYGHLSGGMMEIGYTFCCLYSDKGGRFLVSHIHYRGESSYISSVNVVGKYLFFASGPKFKKTNSLQLGRKCVGKERVFKLVNDGNQLLYITNFGLSLIDVYNFQFDYNTNFGNEYAHSLKGMTISPNKNLLAVSICTWLFTDPVKGKEVYKNELFIYDLKSGKRLVAVNLACEEDNHISELKFDTTGGQLRITSSHVNNVFRLTAKV